MDAEIIFWKADNLSGLLHLNTHTHTFPIHTGKLKVFTLHDFSLEAKAATDIQHKLRGLIQL